MEQSHIEALFAVSHIRGQTRHGRKNEGHTRLEHETWES